MRKPLAVIGFYALVTLAVMLPLLPRFGTHVVGDGSDDPALAWNLWWIKHAWLDLGVSPLSSDFMFYPLGINLAFYTLTLLNGALSLPLQAAIGLVPAANVLLVSSFVLSGFGAYLLAARTLARATKIQSPGRVQAGALIAGLVYAFGANKWLYASLGQFNIASSQWIPFYVLYLWRLRDSVAAEPVNRRAILRDAFLAAVFLAMQGYAEFTFASFLVVLTAIFALAQWRQPRLLAALSIVGMLFFFMFLPILTAMARELAVEGDIFVEGSGFAEAFSVDLAGFVVPSHLHPIFGGFESAFTFPYINFGFLGWVTLALAVFGAWSARHSFAARWWLAATIMFALISLGPDLRINGAELPLPMPFELFQALPLFKGNRYPSRYSVMTLLGAAMLAGYGVSYLASARPQSAALAKALQNAEGFANDASSKLRPVLVAALGVLVLFEHAAVLPLSDFRVPAFYSEIRADPGDFTVLELPLAWRNGFRITGTLDKVFMLSQWYQTTHEKRMLSGNTSRNPELKFQYFTESPVINSLIALETGHDLDAATVERDRALAPDVTRFFGVRYIVLRPEAGTEVGSYLEEVLPNLALWREEPTARIYRLQHSPDPSNRVIDAADSLARLYFAEGWGELGAERVWAQRGDTRLLLPLNESGQQLLFTLWVPNAAQLLKIEVNGVLVAETKLPAGRTVVSVNVPSGVASRPVDDVRLGWRELYPTNTLDPPGAGKHPYVVAKSAGNEVGDFAHIWVDGEDRSPNRRGWNVASLMPNGDRASFDTFASPEESQRLAAFLASHPQTGIALAVRDEASRNLTAPALQQLAGIGAQAKPGWRWSHAFVRLIAPDGSITLAEDASPVRPAIAAVGERITAPRVAGALERIEWRPLPATR